MKLEGSLVAFSLPVVFQLLSFSKKSGGLHLAHDGSDGVVFFAGGQISGASADSSRQPLARRLVGSGTLTDEALADAVQVALSGEGVGVVRALLDQGAVDADLLRVAAGDQSVDAVFDLLRWQNGDFAFVMDEANPDDVGVSMAVEAVLSDAEARRASWDSVSQVVPSPQAVLAMPVVLPADPQVSREEWSLLALVDGRRTVTELVDLTGSGQYAVVSTLAALVTRGLLEVRAEGGAEDSADSDDHVTVVLRRQRLLAPLEGEPFVPVQEAPAEEPAAPVAAKAEPAQETRVEVAAVTPPEPMHSVPDLADDTASDEDGERELATATAGSAGSEGLVMLGGAHVPQDVVPPRPEPFLPRRQADFDEHAGTPAARPVHVQAGPSASMGGLGDVVGATATSPDPDSVSVIERDPNVNRSLMLRLIAGVRGL
ncbi:MAG: hypothetical protein QOD68_2500 [Actinomycetota bacterium]|nr:hypothetical protein [Actinomycetota bacterium]